MIAYYTSGDQHLDNTNNTTNTTSDLLFDTLLYMMDPRGVVSDLVSNGGRRIFREIGVCNYTALTHAPPARGGLIYIIVVVAFFIALAACACGAPLNWFLWVLVFPVAVLWCAYGTSPRCFPMLPPRLPSDVATAIVGVLPGDVPRFSVSENCTMRGFDVKRCFKQCDAAPFSMRSWQDAAAWWVSDISPRMARHAATAASHFYFLQDFEDSATYFAEVIAFGNTYDPDFVAAHRLCALMTSHTIVFAVLVGAVVALMIPPTAVAIAEIFTGAVGLLFHSYAARQIEAG